MNCRPNLAFMACLCIRDEEKLATNKKRDFLHRFWDTGWSWSCDTKINLWVSASFVPLGRTQVQTYTNSRDLRLHGSWKSYDRLVSGWCLKHFHSQSSSAVAYCGAREGLPITYERNKNHTNDGAHMASLLGSSNRWRVSCFAKKKKKRKSVAKFSAFFLVAVMT